MTVYRRKPLEIEAEQYKEDGDPVNGVLYDEWGAFVITIHDQVVYLEDGDWVIQEPDGEHYYPCKPDIFADQYELAGTLDQVTIERNALAVILSGWVTNVSLVGAGWDDWDEYYKDAKWRPNPAREILDIYIAAAMLEREEVEKAREYMKGVDHERPEAYEVLRALEIAGA